MYILCIMCNDETRFSQHRTVATWQPECVKMLPLASGSTEIFPFIRIISRNIFIIMILSYSNNITELMIQMNLSQVILFSDLEI